MISEKNYLDFQKHIDRSVLYKYFWIFWGNYAFIIFVLVGGYIFAKPELHENWQALIGLSVLSFVISRGVVVSLINQFVKRVRPYQRYNTKPEETKFFSFRDKVHDSFPSRHTAAYFSVAAVVFYFYPILGAILIGTSIVAGVARVIMGWHWPTDILGGAIIGSGVAYLTIHFASQLFFTLT
ncbi:MAG TPA: phosphatase PAP2 family protein [Patescibacteria group bacterium]|jgi:undecaprenyl-diphosphatase|nr:phosphatase PAP2 family protein [Patescibacteria group bacterium]